MRRFIILISVLFFNCKGNKNLQKEEFSQTDAYEIMNEHLIKYFKKSHSTIYINSRQLKQPELVTKDNNGNVIELPFNGEEFEPFPTFTSILWDLDQIHGVNFIESEEFNYYFKKNDSIDLKELWESKYNGHLIHNVSYPIYDSKSKTAVVKDFLYSPFLYCGTNLDQLYYFKKTDKGWMMVN